MNNILLVTGASSDVGAALIRRVGEGYDKVLCHYHTSTAVIEDLQAQFGDKIVPLQADFADLDSTNAMIRTILDAGLAPTHFVHLSSDRASSNNIRFSKTDYTHFQHELDVTFRPAVLCCQAFVPRMAKAGGGRVVFMLSSHVTWEPHKPYAAPYTATKHALLGLMKALSAEYAPKAVTVNGVAPAMMDTKFLRCPDLVKETVKAQSPLGRLLTVDDVVPAFAYLLSPEAGGVTGQTIAVTGGL